MNDNAFVIWFFGFCILCGLLFGGEPDLTDAIVKSLMP